MKYILKPSIGYKIQESDKDESSILTLLCEGGRREIELSIDDAGQSFFEALTTEGVTSDAEFFEFFRENNLIIAKSTAQKLLEHDHMQHRSYLYFMELPNAPDLESLESTLSTARVTIIGLGGIGGNVAQALVRSGIRDLVLVDPDVVEDSNLNRQSAFRKKDVGLPKTEALKNFLNEISGDLKLTPAQVTIDDMDPRFLSDRLVINCADNPNIFANTKALFDMNSALQRVVIGGGYFCQQSFIGPLVERSDYERLTARAQTGSNFSHIEKRGGNTFFTASVPASILCNEVIKIITRSDRVMISGKTLIFDWETYDFSELPL